MNDLEIAERHYQTVTILDLVGKIRIGVGNIKLRAALRQMLGEGKHQILLNLADVSHIDSSGLGELVAGYVAVKDIGGKLKLLNLNQRVRELMVMTKLLTVFEVYEDESEAVKSFQIPVEDTESKPSKISAVKANKATINL